MQAVTKWITDNKWVWTTNDTDTGENQIEVHIRDGKYGHALQNGFDDRKSSSFNITAPETKPIATTVTRPSQAAPAPEIAPAPTIESHAESWQKTFGGSGNDNYAESVQQTNDGGYIIAGETKSSGTVDVWLIKTDSAGNKLWDKTFDRGRASSVQQTSDGGYIIAGTSGGDALLIKTDASGDMIWDKTFRGSKGDDAYSVQQTNDGGYIIAGTSDGDALLIKTDASGDMIWDKTFRGSKGGDAHSVQQTNDGGYIIAGANSNTFGGGGAWLIKTDSSGNKLWDKTFSRSNEGFAEAVQQTNDGGYIIAGTSDIDAWLIKTDASGDMIWDRTFGGSKESVTKESVMQTLHGGIGVAQMGYGGIIMGRNSSIAEAVQQTSDGGYIIARSAGSGNGAWLIKTDSAGNKLWDKTFDRSKEGSIARSVQQTNDGGYIIAGYTDSFGASHDAWLIKTDANGN